MGYDITRQSLDEESKGSAIPTRKKATYDDVISTNPSGSPSRVLNSSIHSVGGAITEMIFTGNTSPPIIDRYEADNRFTTQYEFNIVTDATAFSKTVVVTDDFHRLVKYNIQESEWDNWNLELRLSGSKRSSNLLIDNPGNTEESSLVCGQPDFGFNSIKESGIGAVV